MGCRRRGICREAFLEISCGGSTRIEFGSKQDKIDKRIQNDNGRQARVLPAGFYVYLTQLWSKTSPRVYYFGHLLLKDD